jgi:hypothetical protein
MDAGVDPAASTAEFGIIAAHILHLLRVLHAMGLIRGTGCLHRSAVWPASTNSLSDFRDILVTIVERALDYRGAVNRSRESWTFGDGEDSRRVAAPTSISCIAEESERHAQVLDQGLESISRIFDAGLSASAGGVQKWISLFSGEKEKRREEPDSKMMRPFSYSDQRRMFNQRGSEASGTAAAVEETESAHPVSSARQSAS